VNYRVGLLRVSIVGVWVMIGPQQFLIVEAGVTTRASKPAIVERRPAPVAMQPADWKSIPALLLFCVVLLGTVARFWNLDWDGGAYTLHPDEWALNQVVRRLGPDLNPHFFFYGSFPIYLYRGTAQALSWLSGLDWLDTSRVALIGRFYAALCSTLMLPIVFQVGRRLWGVTPGLVAASLTAAAPLLIQAAHFGTVDSMVTLAAVAILWLSLRIADGGGNRTLLATAVVLGLAVATKLTAASFLVMPTIALLAPAARSTQQIRLLPVALRYLGFGLAFVAVALVLSPYYLLDWNEFRAALVEQSQELTGGYALVYTWQFIGTTPYLFEASNLVIWSVGVATGISAFAGWVLMVTRMVLRRVELVPALVLSLWPTFYFLYIGTWEARFVRHTLPLVPFVCLFAAGAVSALLHWASRKDAAFRGLSRAIAALVVMFSALWGLAFLSIYASTDTRLAATDWFHGNVPAGSRVVVEDKDTLIPIPDTAHPIETYELGVIEPTTPDSPAKLSAVASALAGGEYLVISSRRWSATLPRLPNFPLMGRYYRLLFAGDLGYEPVARFQSSPRIGPLVFSDDSAEETFQVFDHPTVQIFRNVRHMSVEALQELLRY
jgi:4-amino-4-deoxy-L-arabinose transferase-like glycosyltransferase